MTYKEAIEEIIGAIFGKKISQKIEKINSSTVEHSRFGTGNISNTINK